MDLMPFLKAKSKKAKMCKECKKPMAKCKCDTEDAADAKGKNEESDGAC